VSSPWQNGEEKVRARRSSAMRASSNTSRLGRGEAEERRACGNAARWLEKAPGPVSPVLMQFPNAAPGARSGGCNGANECSAPGTRSLVSMPMEVYRYTEWGALVWEKWRGFRHWLWQAMQAFRGR